LALSASAASLPPAESTPSTPREFYNSGTARLREFYKADTDKLREGKLREAELLLENVLTSQDERLQPTALFNLGHVRVNQGAEELKKGPAAKPTTVAGRAASQSADEALHSADQALAGDNVQELVAAYTRGRGARKELKAALAAVRKAVETHGNALAKWQRASGDFHSTVELKASDKDARENAETMDRNIAKLVDSLREMQQMMGAMADKERQLGQKLKQMKGRIPAPNMPPGAAGNDEDEEQDQPLGPQPGQKEGPGKEGQEIPISPEQDAWLLDGFKFGGDRRLPMGFDEQGPPKDRKGRNW
jgi:hypothetical protein